MDKKHNKNNCRYRRRAEIYTRNEHTRKKKQKGWPRATSTPWQLLSAQAAPYIWSGSAKLLHPPHPYASYPCSCVFAAVVSAAAVHAAAVSVPTCVFAGKPNLCSSLFYGAPHPSFNRLLWVAAQVSAAAREPKTRSGARPVSLLVPLLQQLLLKLMLSFYSRGCFQP